MSTVLIYASTEAVRERIRLAIGRRPEPDIDPVTFLDAADGPAVVAAVDAGRADVCVLDGEAQPTGGLGVSRQLKNEIADCPPICVIIARPDDRWLATWSQADEVVQHPVDPVDIAAAVARLLRQRASRPPAPAARRGLFAR